MARSPPPWSIVILCTLCLLGEQRGQLWQTACNSQPNYDVDQIAAVNGAYAAKGKLACFADLSLYCVGIAGAHFMLRKIKPSLGL